MENQIIQKAKAKTKLLKENYKPMLTEFRIGDYIKIRQAKSKFTDKMLSKYSNTTYIVTRIGNNSLRVIDASHKSDNIEIKIKKTESILVEKPDDIQIQPQIIDESDKKE
jgi:phosphoenolpyruvate synthase/pyruvate phosphate dikinase